jgi:hypothetical protein
MLPSMKGWAWSPWIILLPIGLAAATLLIIAGVWKLLRPFPLEKMMSTFGISWTRLRTRAVATVEIGVGVSVLVVGGRTALFLAFLLYLGFTTLLSFALVRHLPLDDCGCFGSSEAPVGWAHPGTTALLGIALAGLVAVSGGGVREPPSMLLALGWKGVPVVISAGTLAVLCYGILAVLPRLQARERFRTQLNLETYYPRPTAVVQPPRRGE